MAGETLVTVIGNLTADPELRATAQGPQVCGFTIASTTRTWDRQTGRYEDGDTLFMRCSAWRDLAEHCASTLAKGMRVIARGRLRQRSWQAQDGTSRTMTEMTVDEIGPSLRYASAWCAPTSSAAWRTRGATCPPPAAGPTRAWTRTPARSGRTEMGKRKHGRQRLDHERRLARKTRHPRRRPGTTKEQ